MKINIKERKNFTLQISVIKYGKNPRIPLAKTYVDYTKIIIIVLKSSKYCEYTLNFTNTFREGPLIDLVRIYEE